MIKVEGYGVRAPQNRVFQLHVATPAMLVGSIAYHLHGGRG